MDRPALEARPPALIDGAVRLLIPPACREHILGDLWERYRSPSAFLLDAVRTVPFVIASQIRRTSSVGAVIIQAFLMTVALVTGSRGIRPALLPAAAGLVALVLRDAYKRGPSLSARQVCADIAVGIFGVAVSQALAAAVRPDLLLPMPGGAGAVAAAFFMLFLLRLQTPGLGSLPRQAYVHAPASLDALLTEVRMHERLSRRGANIEIGAGIVVSAVFGWGALSAPNWALRAGLALGSAYGLFVAGFVLRQMLPSILPDGLGFQRSLTFYRAELERRHRYVRTMWLWYLLPFSPATLFIVLGSVLLALERGRPLWPAAIVLLVCGGIGWLIHLGSRDMARRLQARIDALNATEER